VSREILHRSTVDVGHEEDLDGLAESLRVHVARHPTGDCRSLTPFGFSFRREPAVFHFVATGTCLGTAIMLAEFSTRIPAATTFARVLAACFFVAALYTITAFLRNAVARLEVVAVGDQLSIRRHGLLGTHEDRVPAETIVGVIVAKDESGARSVVLAGPRHAALLDVHRAKLLDAESLPVWLADGIALVARRATVRVRVPIATE
jgi:hypothetical protein